ncbi:hypothetical protein C2E23DRAFT_890715 [Lenzites betulinus]|nr:hypothetical protein C2E23DRAFT_890715 [Lenzites betulinus]
MSNTSEATRLKAEGNALFLKGNFSRAYEKYSQAIKHDDGNAILYCNRAACSLGLNRYIEAYTDADQATKLDSTYAKAWARLATACAGLGKLEQTVASWKRAIAVLPVEHMTPAEQKQKDQYATELKGATARLERRAREIPATDYVSTRAKSEHLPWDRAKEIIRDMGPNKTWNSSAWAIAHAHAEWSRGIELMKQMRPMRTAAGMGYIGRSDAIMILTNGLLADSRVFAITEQDFSDRYNRQVLFELSQTKAWSEGGSRRVIAEAPVRLAAEGWDSLRPALSLTVRAWIMRAFIQSNVTNEPEAALDFYTSAIEVLQWGRSTWKDISSKDRGAIFQESFLRGIKCLRLETLMMGYSANPGPTSKFPLSEILAGAEDIIKEVTPLVNQPPTEEHMFGFHLSFVRYPLANAYSLRGFYHQHTARNIRNAMGPASDVVEHFKTAAQEYIQAADIYPSDEENHIMCLMFAADALLEARSPAGEVVKLFDRINDAIPVVNLIWEFSANATAAVNGMLERDMDFRDRLVQKMQEGRLTADDPVSRNL